MTMASARNEDLPAAFSCKGSTTMTNRMHHRGTFRCDRRRPSDRGIVLLIVLGMLSLFTVLIVSFVVFSSQSVQSSAASQERRLDELLPKPPVEAAVLQLISGTNDHNSAAFGASLLEDFYGTDGLMLRVAHRRPPGTPPTASRPTPAAPGGQLMLPLSGTTPQTTLFKLPTNLAYWNEDGSVGQIDQTDYSDRAIPNYYNTLRTNLRAQLDDVISGRLITFDEGPLKDQSFRVVRYFGVENGYDSGGGTITTAWDYSLAGSVIIDLAEIGTESILVNGVSERLYDIAANSPNALLYSVGDDGLPGRGGVDDNGINGIDDFAELGAANSDDIGYRFVLNGGVFNGRGLNPEGTTGVQRNGGLLDAFGNIEFTLNARLTGSSYSAVDGVDGDSNVTFPEPDEAWDAADMENIFLAWQPSDHRRPLPASAGNAVYGGVEADRLNAQMGQHIIPSFHRPALINYIMNSPIYLAGEGPLTGGGRTFAQIKNSFDSGQNDGLRLQQLVTQLRRATIRPLNFPHEYVNAVSSDLDADGIPFDGAPQFSGSNSVSILNQTIDLSGSPPQIIAQVENLARWLVNGPWDIDNDGDGLPDSVWVDFNLPVTAGPDGKLLKPMVAPLIEDLDGKINLNYTGSYNQLVRARFPQTGLTQYANQVQYDTVNGALNVFGHGGGIGPAEIDFSHLFASDFALASLPPGQVGPLRTLQTGASISLDQALRTRYGNLMNVRYGGSIFNYAGSYPYDPSIATYRIPPVAAASYPQNLYPFNYPYPTNLPAGARLFNFLHYPGVGTRLYPSEQADLLARIPFPSRSINHTSGSVAGRPLDYSGTERTRKDTTGSHEFTSSYPGADIANQPYEFGATETRGDDRPFTPAEYVDFLAGGPLGGRLAELLSDAAQRNEALTRLVTTESRAVDSPEVPGLVSIVQLFADRIAQEPSADPDLRIQTTLINRMLAVELRKGSKLNLNRQIGNEQRDATGTPRPSDLATPPHVPNLVVNGLADESAETYPHRLPRAGGGFEQNLANNRSAIEAAFPQLDITLPQTQSAQSNLVTQSGARAHYGPNGLYVPGGVGGIANFTNVPDFDGVDLNGDGDLADAGEGTDVDGDGEADEIATGSELLARHLYCLMFALITGDIDAGSGELVPNYPYPGQLGAASVGMKNDYVARQLAQWAVNAVDYRDVDAKFTRLRYDPNPFDTNGFSLQVAAGNVVWGMERPEAQLTESIALHDKRLKRNLPERLDATTAPPTSDDQDGVQNNNELPGDEEPTDTSQYPADSDMDQFRMPQASAFVEIQALAPQVSASVGAEQPSLPGELYTNNRLDLSRVVGAGDNRSPVWRIAVGSNHGGDRHKSTRYMFDADRINAIEDDNEGSGNYLGDGIDWNADRAVELDNWNGATFTNPTRYTADIRHSRSRISVPPVGGDLDPPRTEYVTIADTDMDPTNDAAGGGGGAPNNPSRIRLERFVWFTDLRPDASATLRVVNDQRSGMRLNNVFFHRRNASDPADQTLPENTQALLAPGQFAVVAPRPTTHFGQKTTSTAGNNYLYDPSDQKLELARQNLGAGVNRFRMDYYDSANADNNIVATNNSQTPRYEEDNNGAYDVNEVLPIVCQSLYPSELPGYVADPMLFDWQDYLNNVAAEDRVDMGFNISAPLPGPTYYLAPEYQINSNPNANNQTYPFDGYRDVEQSVTTGMDVGFFPDVPFDHEPGRPLEDNSYVLDLVGGERTVRWNAVGTHQEAATVFLQRLADPTRPWHATNNPYITVDFLPMDLTTFNGEEDVRQRIQRKTGLNAGPPASPILEDQLVDNRSDWNTTHIGDANFGNTQNGFVPELQLDTRRKVPNLELDRALSAILPTGGGTERAVITHRPRLSMTTSDLRPTAPNGAAVYWRFDLGAMWNSSHNPTVAIDTRYRNPSQSPLAFDDDAGAFRQTLGFVNREYGLPVRSNSPRQIANGGIFRTGDPDYCLFHTVPWMNREFRSPVDLINVPAVSRTRLLATYTPETRLEDNGQREIPTNVWETFEYQRSGGTVDLAESHRLGFATGMASIRNDDYASQPPLGVPIDDASDYDDWTGDRAGFEMIFDYVDAGPVWFDSQRWFDPASVQFQVGDTTTLTVRELMFNRAVETLQPPYNYIGLNRTPGKINLNTTPDYIRKGPNFAGRVQDFLDGRPTPATGGTPPPPNPPLLLEDPSRPNVLPASSPSDPTPSYVLENPGNDSVRGDGLSSQFASSKLFGNGSVYRSLAWGNSTLYELDDAKGAPATLGENNLYEANVDTSFGRGFKAFIESRRGYSATQPGIAPGVMNLSNPVLDYRYPTQFAGVFAPSIASRTPSVRRFMRSDTSAQNSGYPRRMHDMGVLRPHPDFDLRTLTNDQLSNNSAASPQDWGVTEPQSTRFSLSVEADASASPLNDPSNSHTTPTLTNGMETAPDPALDQVANLRMPLINSGLFERPQAELHMNQRALDRDSFFRYRDAARLAGMTTNHSNVYLMRLTLGYFEVDPETGAVGQEFVSDTGAPQRSRATYIIDRTVPVGFLRGKVMNAEDTILYSELQE